MRKNTAKCEKVRTKYVTDMRSDISQRVRGKKFSAKKLHLSSTFFSFRLRKSFADQSEFVYVWQVATFQLHDVIMAVASQHPSSFEMASAITINEEDFSIRHFVESTFLLIGRESF